MDVHANEHTHSILAYRHTNQSACASNTFPHMYVLCTMLCNSTYMETRHLNIHLNADAELQLSPHTDNTFGWLFQLGLSSALLLFCTDSSFHWVRRDKATSSFLYYTHLKPLDCEKSFNAVPLRGEKNSLKKLHSLANLYRFTFQSQCQWPLKEQCSYIEAHVFFATLLTLDIKSHSWVSTYSHIRMKNFMYNNGQQKVIYFTFL